MTKHKTEKPSIGMVLSTVPKYSETFFRNKIKGLQEAGFCVVLFVDYVHADAADFACKVVAGKNFNVGFFKALWYSFLAISKSLFVHPKRSYRLYALNKKDGMSLKKNIRSIILNQFFFNEQVDWLHFGFGMLAVTRENVAAAMDAKMAVSFRGYDLYLSPLKHPGCYDVLFTKAVKYHVLSQEMQQELQDYKIACNKIQVITPAIDTHFFTASKRNQYGNVLQLATVARLHWKKGFVYTLEALALLKKKGIAFHYTIIGDGEERERLVFAAQQLGILEHITFTGKLLQTEIKKQLEQTAIYVQYSIQEGFCNAVLEAQSLGLLCVVSNAEGLAENVLDTKTGWVVPKREPEALAKKIEAVFSLPDEEKQKIKTNAITRVQNTFGLQQQHKAFVRFYGLNKEI
ncbi:glycosyltransferase family 4 protein [Lacinutrix sp. C3R15]|uniref:glycosyltransferase family 4 protein n=1 Tax=Flavobacteriaceae TaxID=49546 RepID=UPI001C0A04D4|nr:MULTISPECIES: glycosyltransferase family 4 protein [Flavobacteriaceae]MBU2939583.1 glycosyltransferase family 4 protein [Lacinutrix sp. C3R15]MDO6622897.1 glycosyltransferase family 4 protein [Oceanihabitans sp. 1_MG-2023]